VLPPAPTDGAAHRQPGASPATEPRIAEGVATEPSTRLTPRRPADVNPASGGGAEPGLFIGEIRVEMAAPPAAAPTAPPPRVPGRGLVVPLRPARRGFGLGQM
jgi:hypothetical protein